MTKPESQIIDMLGRVCAFGAAYESKLPKKSLVGAALAGITTAIARAYELAAVQDPRTVQFHTNARQIARDALNSQLDAIHQTALAVSIDIPGADKNFRMPRYPRQDRAVIQAADEFATQAVPLKKAFVDHHMPKDFIDTLNTTAESFRQAINGQDAAKNDRSKASAQLTETIEEALTDLQRVESIVRNTLGGDASAMAEWESARHVKKVRKKKRKAKPNDPTAPPAPVPIPAEPAVAPAEPAGPQVPVPPTAGEEAAGHPGPTG